MDTLRIGALSIAIVYILYRACASLIGRYLVRKLTALNEFSEIGTKSSRKSDKLRGTVVICGGSVAGLLAAKVCADHFEKVVIVESEEWVTTPNGYTGSHRKELANKKRSHVAQYKAAHMYLGLLVETLIKWFPNFKEECEKMGGRIVPQTWPISVSGLPPADPFSLRGNHPRTITMIRAGFESLLRRLVMNSCQNVQYLAGTVLGLEQTGDSIAGVLVKTAKGEEVTLTTILAIDCTGASSSGLRWLKDLATAAANEMALKQLNNLRLTYDPKQSYHTCDFDVPPGLVPRIIEIGFPSDWDSTAVVYAVIPDMRIENRILGIARKDYNYLEILCGGWAVSGEIASVEDIRSYLSSFKLHEPLPTWVFRLLDLLEEYNVPFTVDYARLGNSIYIPYDRYKYMPRNFIAMGDSVMRLNPLRGVGCTKACIEALSLNNVLNKCHRQKGTEVDKLHKDFSKEFHATQASRIESDWDGERAQDYALASTVPSKGDDPKTFGNFRRLYSRHLIHAALTDKDVASTLGYLRCYLASPTDLFAPKILFKVLKAKLFYTSPFSS